MSTLVEVRPIEVKKWHGKVGSESFTRPKKMQALVDTETMKYSTGLSVADIKDLKAKGIKYDLSDNFDSEAPHPFWDSNMSMFKLENNTMFFDVSLPLNFIKVKIMRASKYIANSMSDYNEGLYPEATHVLFDESEEADIVASKVATKTKAIVEASKLSVDKKIELIMIIDGKNLKGQSSSFVEVALDRIITKDADSFLRHLNMDKKEVTNYALVLECLQKSILRKEGHKIMHMDSLLGIDELEVAKYLSEDENQDLKLVLLSQANN
jgi:hypothetical protein